MILCKKNPFWSIRPGELPPLLRPERARVQLALDFFEKLSRLSERTNHQNPAVLLGDECNAKAISAQLVLVHDPALQGSPGIDGV